MRRHQGGLLGKPSNGVEQHLKLFIGEMAVTIARLSSENEALRAALTPQQLRTIDGRNGPPNEEENKR